MTATSSPVARLGQYCSKLLQILAILRIKTILDCAIYVDDGYHLCMQFVSTRAIITYLRRHNDLPYSSL